MAEHSLADYYRAIAAAVQGGDVHAVPGLLTLMALDGFGHEAEETRRRMVTTLAVINGEPT